MLEIVCAEEKLEMAGYGQRELPSISKFFRMEELLSVGISQS